MFQNLKIFGLFHVVSESINLINQNDISNVTRHSERSEESPELSNFDCHPEFVTRHSERSEESPELSDSTSESKVIVRSRIECGMTKGCHSGNHVIASPSGRGNPIKSIANAIEPMGLLRRFAPHNDKLNNNYFVPLTCHPEFISGSINLISSTRAGVITKLIDPESSSG